MQSSKQSTQTILCSNYDMIILLAQSVGLLTWH